MDDLDSLAGSEYLDRLRAFLTAVPGASDVDIHAAAPDATIRAILPIGIKSGGRAAPLVLGMRIVFRLHVPIAEQFSVLRPLGIDDPESSEDFRIVLIYGSSRPSVFVSSLRSLDPSMSVAIVREHLEQFSEKYGFVVETLAPSPCPVDGVLLEVDGRDSTNPGSRLTHSFEWSETRALLRAYAQAGAFESTEAAEDALFHRLSDGVQTFYKVVAAERRISEQRDELAALNQDVIKLHRDPGLKTWLRRTYVGGRRLRDLAVGVATFEARQSQVRRSFERSTDSEYGGGDALAPMTRSYINTSFDADTRPWQVTADLFERRRLTAVQARSGVAAALVAAAIGAGVTYVATRPSEPTLIRPTIVVRQPPVRPTIVVNVPARPSSVH